MSGGMLAITGLLLASVTEDELDEVYLRLTFQDIPSTPSAVARQVTHALERVRAERAVQEALTGGTGHPCRGCDRPYDEHPNPDCEGWY